MKCDIEKYENAIVIGDFNSNPFEEAIVALSRLNNRWNFVMNYIGF